MSNIFKIILNDKATEFIEISDGRKVSSCICSTCHLPIFSRTYFKTYDVKDHIRYSTFIGYFYGVLGHELCHVCFKQLQENPNEFKFKYQHGLL